MPEPKHVNDAQTNAPCLLLSAHPNRAENVFLLLAGIFLSALVVTNIIAGKYFEFFGFDLSCGIIAYPITFLATDLLSELYGKRRASQVVVTGFAVSVFVTLLIVIATTAPPAEITYVDQQSFQTVFGLTPGVVMGSMMAYLAAQFIDVHLYEFWRRLTRGKHLWLRNNASTVVSQLVDTSIVTSVILVVWPSIDGNPGSEPISAGQLVTLVVGQYLFKAAVALFDTPIMYLSVYYLRRWVVPAAELQSAVASIPASDNG